MYKKYSMRGGIEWQNTAQGFMLYLPLNPTPYTVFFRCTSRVNSALSDLLFCVGRLAVAVDLNGFV